MLIVNSALLKANFVMLRERKFCTVNAKCGAAKIYGLRLGFSNSHLSSHISLKNIKR